MDKYDQAIEYLTKNPKEIAGAWTLPHRTGGILFAMKRHGGSYCPSMVASYGYATTKQEQELVDKLRVCGKVINREDIKVEHLPLFADIQRYWDTLKEV